MKSVLLREGKDVFVYVANYLNLINFVSGKVFFSVFINPFQVSESESNIFISENLKLYIAKNFILISVNK